MLNFEMTKVDRASAKSRTSHVTNVSPHSFRSPLWWKKKTFFTGMNL